MKNFEKTEFKSKSLNRKTLEADQQFTRMTRLLAVMVSATEHLLTNFLARKPARFNFFSRKSAAKNLSNIPLEAKALLSEDDVTVFAVADVTNAFAVVRGTVQRLAADLIAVDWLSTFDISLRLATRASP